MCDESRDVDTKEMTLGELLELKLEHPSYWNAERDACLDTADAEPPK